MEKKSTILVAEDEPSLLALVSQWLVEEGYGVVRARDGEEACARAESEFPNLILLDVVLPRKDGYSVLIQLRGDPMTRPIPVVFISGEPVGKHREIAQTFGALGFLPKPFSKEQLLEVVRGALAGRPHGPATTFVPIAEKESGDGQ